MDERNSRCMYPNLSANTSNDQQCRLNKINEIKNCFIPDFREREIISKKLSKYIAFFAYLDKSLIVLSEVTGSISIASFATAIGAIRTIRNKKKKHNKIVMLTRSKLNSIESKISEALINNKISHEDLMTVEYIYWELKESVRKMNSKRSDVEKISLIEEGKK